jgi:hypothetical protein
MKQIIFFVLFIISIVEAERLSILGVNSEASRQAKSANLSVGEIREAHNEEQTEFVRDEPEIQIYKGSLPSTEDNQRYVTFEYSFDTNSRNITAINVVQQFLVDGKK